MQKQPFRGALMKRRSEKKCSKSTGEHSCCSETPSKPPCSFIEATLQRRRSLSNLLQKSAKTPSQKSTPKGCKDMRIFKNPN